MEDLCSSNIPDYVILASMTEFYHSDGGVNTINNWIWETVYQVKAMNEFEITHTGSMIDPPEVVLDMGWNLIPVLTPCGVGTDELFNGMASLNIVKEVAGTSLYWPQFGITTLVALESGKAYRVSVNDAGSFIYPECTNSDYRNIAINMADITPGVK